MNCQGFRSFGFCVLFLFVLGVYLVCTCPAFGVFGTGTRDEPLMLRDGKAKIWTGLDGK